MLDLLTIGTAELSKVTLVQDLSAVLLVAGVVAVVFHLLGWPKVIGYIAAGALLRLEPLRSLVMANEDSIHVLANLGVIFLMFHLGLELNIRKLRKAGGTVFPAAVVDLGMMLLVGFAVGRYGLGWGVIPSLFMGAVICDSSTTLLAKSLAEMGCEKERFASIIFGVTISEDVLTIGVMAVLTGLAMTGQFQAKELTQQLGILLLFLSGVLIFGLLLLPPLLNRLVSKLQDDETLLLIVMGVCFGISLIAERLQFSLALGAFLVGAVIAESKVRKRVMENTMGLRSVFSAVFFVTIGLMVDGVSIWANKWCILLFVAVVIVCKTLNNLVVSFVTGQSFRESFQIGVGLAQIGDFAYLVALLGMTLQNSASPYPEMYQIAVGVSIITTLLNPFLLRHAGGFADGLLARLPVHLSRAIAGYTKWMKRTGKELKTGEQRKRFVRCGLLLGLNAVLLGVIFMVGVWLSDYQPIVQSLPELVQKNMDSFTWLACSLLSLPIMVNGYLLARRLALIISGAFLPSGAVEERGWQQGLRRLCSLLVLVLCLGVQLLEYINLSALLFWDEWVCGCVVVLLGVGVWLGWDRLRKMAVEANDTLREVMMREDEAEEEMTPDGAAGRQEVCVVLAEGAGVVGISLKRLRLRNHTGATVARIVRADGTAVTSPGADVVLGAGDAVYMLCEAGREDVVREYLGRAQVEVHDEVPTVSVVLPESAGVLGVNLGRLRLRNHTGATVSRIIRADGTVLGSPGPEAVLSAGDTVELQCGEGQEERVRQYLCRRDVEVHGDMVSLLLDVHAERVRVPEGSAVCGRSLAELRLRNRTGVTVAAIERGGTGLAGLPGPDTVLLAGDFVSFLGTSEQIAATRLIVNGEQA